VILDDAPSVSRIDTPLWDALARAVAREFRHTRLLPQLHMGFTDARVFRRMGAVAYGAGLLSPDVDSGDFARRFHGNNERVDIESLRLSAELWRAVAEELLQ
jgi:acetylornithine deacetylase/succinyl-diaminopimelate desuccinylase-like protein